MVALPEMDNTICSKFVPSTRKLLEVITKFRMSARELVAVATAPLAMVRSVWNDNEEIGVLAPDPPPLSMASWATGLVVVWK